MQNIEIFAYVIIAVAVIAFLVIVFRSKADVDYLQESKGGKIINSSTRIGFFILLAFTVFYSGFQMFHNRDISEVIVLLFLGIAFGGKGYIDLMKGKQNKPPEP